MHQDVWEPERCQCGDLFRAFYVDAYQGIQFWYWCPSCDELKRKG